MTNSLLCENPKRRRQIRQQKSIGIDYVEVELSDKQGNARPQAVLRVYFFGDVPSLQAKNILLTGGRRILGKELQILPPPPKPKEKKEEVDKKEPAQKKKEFFEISIAGVGDFSTYTLHLVEDNKAANIIPLASLDQRYAQADFTFKVDCPSDLDCAVPDNCPPPQFPEPVSNYLAKDYASFRQLMLDRLALIIPDWQERHVPDIGITLVELLAYAGDYLSYYQDAVATEAYLETARERISVRRHVRLVDYPMHEGCNARALVCVATEANELKLSRADCYFVTGHNEALASLHLSGSERVLTQQEMTDVPRGVSEIFEPMLDEVKIYQAHNKINFYAWGDAECCLLSGATSATLVDEWVADKKVDYSHDPQQQAEDCEPAEHPHKQERKLYNLHIGDILIFEEVKGAKTGLPADADPRRRHAVRLTQVTPAIDFLYEQPVVEIEWERADALPFTLCLSALDPHCKLIKHISVAHGNVMLVDHGKTVTEKLDDEVPLLPDSICCEDENEPAEIVTRAGKFSAKLKKPRLTFRQSFAPDELLHTPVANLFAQAVRGALPQISLTDALKNEWLPRRDLLESGARDMHFVTEIDNESLVHLRFGDGESGRQPEAKSTFTARYRVGNGSIGNVGAEAISHLVFRANKISGANLQPRNPLPAQGGSDPETLAEVKLLAPHTFRKDLQRAITADDYARLAERSASIQRAAARLRWTGSWYEAQVTVDPLGTEDDDENLRSTVSGSLHRYRRMGHDLSVRRVQYVPLEIEIEVCVQPHYLRAHLEAELLDLFSTRVLDNKRRGFFHPDNLSFGDDIALSRLVALAQSVEGVQHVTINKFQRLFELQNGEIANGVLALNPFEIAQCDNDPNFPEHGKLKLIMKGGRS